MIRKYFDFRITVATIVALVILVGTWIAGFERDRVKREALASEFRQHKQEDKAKFEALATKESSDLKYQELQRQYAEIIKRLDRIEAMHLKK